MIIRYFNKTITFMKVLISKYFLDDNIFYKTIDFIKVMISKIIYDNKIF
jgi:hypothetical protein